MKQVTEDREQGGRVVSSAVSAVKKHKFSAVLVVAAILIIVAIAA